MSKSYDHIYRAHCEDCCQILNVRSRIKTPHDYHDPNAHLDMFTTDELLEVKKSIIRHIATTGHSKYLLYEESDNLRPFKIESCSSYNTITITDRERSDLEYIIELEEQCRGRNYLRLEELKNKS